MNANTPILRYVDIRDQVLKVTPKTECLYFPVGVTPSGMLDLVKFPMTGNIGRSICIVGSSSSGKHNYIEFIIESLSDMYRVDAHFEYFVASDYEVKVLCKDAISSNTFIATYDTEDGLLSLCDGFVTSNLMHKLRVVVIDVRSTRISTSLIQKIALLQDKGTHVILLIQNPSTVEIDKMPILDICDLLCTTAIDTEASVRLYGSTISCVDNIGKYGRIAYRYQGSFGVNNCPLMGKPSRLQVRPMS